MWMDQGGFIHLGPCDLKTRQVGKERQIFSCDNKYSEAEELWGYYYQLKVFLALEHYLKSHYFPSTMDIYLFQEKPLPCFLYSWLEWAWKLGGNKASVTVRNSMTSEVYIYLHCLSITPQKPHSWFWYSRSTITGRHTCWPNIILDLIPDSTRKNVTTLNDHNKQTIFKLISLLIPQHDQLLWVIMITRIWVVGGP